MEELALPVSEYTAIFRRINYRRLLNQIAAKKWGRRSLKRFLKKSFLTDLGSYNL
jgi:hypothetical protein